MIFDHQVKHGRRDICDRLIEEVRHLTQSKVEIELVRQRSWASVTFTGIRYCFRLISIDGWSDDQKAALSERLAAHEFDLRSHFVANCIVKDVGLDHPTALGIELLLVDDPVSQTGHARSA